MTATASDHRTDRFGSARRPGRFLVGVIGVAVGLTAGSLGCSTTDPGGSDPAGQLEEGIVVELGEIGSQPSGARVTVSGFVVEDGGTVVVAEALAESFPPQAGGSTVEVDGLDVDGLPGLNREGPIRWTAGPVTLSAVVDGGRLAEAGLADDQPGDG